MFKMIKNEIKYKLIKDNKYGVYFSFTLIEVLIYVRTVEVHVIMNLCFLPIFGQAMQFIT